MTDIDKHQIYQIYYDEKTKIENDKGFRQLDNISNNRADWHEYWPIRNFLTNTELVANSYYGFLSPKFKEKTGLESKDVYESLNSSDADIVSFSPYFDQMALPINIFEQAILNHPGIYQCLDHSFRLLRPESNINTIVMTSRNTIFCNYFVAKKKYGKNGSGIVKLYLPLLKTLLRQQPRC